MIKFAKGPITSNKVKDFDDRYLIINTDGGGVYLGNGTTSPYLVSNIGVDKDLFFGEIIFQNDQGEEGNVVVLKSFENFDYIKIFAITNDGHMFCEEVDSPNNKKVSIHTSILGWQDFFVKSKVFELNGINMNIVYKEGVEDSELCGEYSFNNQLFTRDRKFIKIVKIIGYKRHEENLT